MEDTEQRGPGIENRSEWSNETVHFDRTGPTEKRGQTSKSGPLFSKLFRLARTDPLSFRPKFPEILVEWIAPTMWSENERMKSSTWRELYAIEFALRSFCGELNDSRVKWLTDNRAAAKIVEVGSMRYDLQCFALRIFQICLVGYSMGSSP